MALDPNIILQAGNFRTPDYAETMERRAAIQLRNAEVARTQRNDQLAQAKTMRLGEIGSLASTGNLKGAREQALASGDFDVLEHINRLEDQQRTALQRRVEVAAPLAFEAAKMPYETRKAFIAAQTRRLLANGWSAEELADFDPTDQALGSIVASAQSINDMLKRQDQRAEFDDKRADRAADREFARGNAYISAGVIPPEAGGAGVAAGGSSGAPDIARMVDITLKAEGGGTLARPNVSPKGAVGPMQVMPGTNVDPGFGVRPAADNSQEERARVGRDYLSAMVQRYGNPRQAWAAYNAGPGRVDEAIKRGGQNWLAMLPKETRDYVNRNMAALGGGGQSAPGAGPGGLQVIPGGKLDKPKARRMTPAEVQAEGLDPNMVYYRGTDGQPQAVSGQSRSTSLKAAPSTALTNYQENNAALKTIRDALWLLDPANSKDERVKHARGAIGPGTGALGDTFTQLHDPKGNDFRAMLGRIGGIIIKDTSGAAVSASEDARLAKWVPLPTDTPEAAMSKLRNLAAALSTTQQAFEDIYNEDNGYRPLRVRGTLTAKPAAAKPRGKPSVGTVQGGYRFKGGDPAKPASWEKVR